MKLLAWLVALVACGGRPAAPTPLSQVTPTTAAAPVLDPITRFEHEARAVAARDDRYVAGWGTARLDDGRPVRFATLAPIDLTNDRGAYLIEQAPDALWLASFAYDGRTQPFHNTSGMRADPLPWETLRATAIDHVQGHHHGDERFALELDHGVLVVSAYHYLEDGSDPGAHTVNRGCCSPAAAFYFRDSAMRVTGPAASIEELVEGPPPPALGIDWEHAPLATEADAIALWQAIAPRGDELDRVDLIPEGAWTEPLAVALLHAGHFACAPAAGCSGPAEPATDAGLGDPCVRRQLARWALVHLREPTKLPAIADALRELVQLPPPERELVDAAIDVAVADAALERELLALAWRAGHHGPRVLAGIRDQVESPKFLASLVGPLVPAARSADCSTAAVAAIALERAGDRRFLPRRPRSTDVPAMLRALCVMARYHQAGGRDGELVEESFADAGLELTDVHDDIARDPVILDRDHWEPSDDLLDAFDDCTGTTCRSTTHAYTFGFTPVHGRLALATLEVEDRPRCGP